MNFTSPSMILFLDVLLKMYGCCFLHVLLNMSCNWRLSVMSLFVVTVWIAIWRISTAYSLIFGSWLGKKYIYVLKYLLSIRMITDIRILVWLFLFDKQKECLLFRKDNIELKRRVRSLPLQEEKRRRWLVLFKYRFHL